MTLYYVVDHTIYFCLCSL